MKIFFLILLFVQSIYLSQSKFFCQDKPQLCYDWEQFKIQYNKNYESDEIESHRFNNFKLNAEISTLYNQLHELTSPDSAIYGVTQFSDLSADEFKHRFLMMNPSKKFNDHSIDSVDQSIFDGTLLPNSFDWRDVSPPVITPIKNQLQCGSCWAESATETIESQWALAGNPLVNLSVQQSVDCCSEAYGCMGGWPSWAYESILSREQGGIESESEYPYHAVNQKCQFESNEVIAKISNWTIVTNDRNETFMAQWVANVGPLSVCLDASTWMNYKSGIIMPQDCGTWIDHCVQIVGYATSVEKKIPYWIVRNSWGTSWGMDGYLFIYRGNNTCSIASVVTSVVV